MIQVSNTYNSIIESGHYEWQILNGTSVISDLLVDGSLKQTLYEKASIGNVLARQLDIEFYKDITINTALPLVLQFRAVNDTEQSEWYGKGEYWVDTYETSPYTDKAKITAWDSLLKANVTYLKSGTWTPTTDLAILQSVANDIDVDINADTLAMFATTTTIDEAPSIGENGTTDMQMLSYIAIMKGCNVIINDDNELEFIPLFAEKETGADGVDIGDAVTDFDASDGEEITGVALWRNENSYYRYPDVTDAAWEALGGRKINANLFIGATQALAQSLYTSLGGKTYYPYTAPTAWVDPKWQLGDWIKIKDVTSVICNQTIKLDALASSSLSAEGQKEVNSSYPQLTAQERDIAQTKQSVASIQIQTDSIQSTVTEVQGDLSSVQTQVTQNSEGIEAVTQRVDESESYLRWDGSTATLTIGESSSPTEAEISPSGFAVVQDGEAIFEAKGRKAQARHLVGTETVTVGNWQWVDEGSDGFSLVYIG